MEFRQALFWDTDPSKIDQEKNARYIIERVADFGHDDEVRWILKRYNRSFTRKVIEKSRCLMPRTKALWKLLLKE